MNNTKKRHFQQDINKRLSHKTKQEQRYQLQETRGEDNHKSKLVSAETENQTNTYQVRSDLKYLQLKWPSPASHVTISLAKYSAVSLNL